MRRNIGGIFNEILRLLFLESSEGVFYCSSCHINFMGENAVVNHRKTNAHLTRMVKERSMGVSGVDPVVGLPENFACDYCGKTSDTVEEFRQHIFDTSHDKVLSKYFLFSI